METTNSTEKTGDLHKELMRPLWQQGLLATTLIGSIFYAQNQNPNNNPTRDDVRSLHTAPQVVQTEQQALNDYAKPNIPTAPDEITERQKVEKRTTIPNILDNKEIAEKENSSTKI
jgi:hypothetical protein